MNLWEKESGSAGVREKRWRRGEWRSWDTKGRDMCSEREEQQRAVAVLSHPPPRWNEYDIEEKAHSPTLPGLILLLPGVLGKHRRETRWWLWVGWGAGCGMESVWVSWVVGVDGGRMKGDSEKNGEAEERWHRSGSIRSTAARTESVYMSS